MYIITPHLSRFEGVRYICDAYIIFSLETNTFSQPRPLIRLLSSLFDERKRIGHLASEDETKNNLYI